MPEDFRTIVEFATDLRSGRTTAVKLADRAFDRIEALDPLLNAFVSLTRDRAMKEASIADERLANDPSAPLVCGIPFAAKDIFDVEGEVTQGGCPVLSGNRAEIDSNAVKRLSAAGMVLVGKTRTSPLACEITGLNHSETISRNPWKEEPHIAGGSSSGSGVAVAAGMVPVALGSDTGGSVRVPAALCGVVGHKSTLGEIGRGGMLPLADSFDTVGALTRSINDAALVFEVLRGEDPRDRATNQRAQLRRPAKRLEDCRIVVAEGALFDGADGEIVKSVRDVGKMLKELGATVENREVPVIAEAAQAKEIEALMAAEAWRNTGKILETWGGDRDWLTDWIVGGKDIDPSLIEELRSVQIRLQSKLSQDESEIDAFLAPTVRATTRPIEAVDANFMEHMGNYLSNTIVGNCLNLCAMSLPSDLDSEGRPIAAMIMAPAFADDLLLSIGIALQASAMQPGNLPATPA